VGVIRNGFESKDFVLPVEVSLEKKRTTSAAVVSGSRRIPLGVESHVTSYEMSSNCQRYISSSIHFPESHQMLRYISPRHSFVDSTNLLMRLLWAPGRCQSPAWSGWAPFKFASTNGHHQTGPPSGGQNGLYHFWSRCRFNDSSAHASRPPGDTCHALIFPTQHSQLGEPYNYPISFPKA
jgi:hypothetical protein